MIYWITGLKNSGKTTYSKILKEELEKNGKRVLIYDGDEVREYFKEGFENKDRDTHINRISSFASIAEKQGFDVIIALVSPKKEWRMKARKLFQRSILIYLPGGELWKGTTYEIPDHEEIISTKMENKEEKINELVELMTPEKDEFKGMTKEEIEIYLKENRNYPEISESEFMKFPFKDDTFDYSALKTGQRFRFNNKVKKGLSCFLEAEVIFGDEITVNLRLHNCWII